MNHRILLVDDHEIFTRGVRRLLEAESDLEIVAEARSGRAAVDLATKHTPDLIVMDLSMPDMNGMDATRAVRDALPDAKVLCLSMHAEGAFVSAALDAGACGYVLKDSAVDELIRAIRTAIAGHVHLSPRIADRVLEQFRQRGESEDATAFSLLSQREREVLQLIAEGVPTKQIAQRLFISVKTVGTHREHIMEKTGVYSVAELTRYAIREGLTELD